MTSFLLAAKRCAPNASSATSSHAMNTFTPLLYISASGPAQCPCAILYVHSHSGGQTVVCKSEGTSQDIHLPWPVTSQDIHLPHVRIYAYFGSGKTSTRVDEYIYLHKSGFTSSRVDDNIYHRSGYTSTCLQRAS
eukprot:5088293-Amphidinium_carterae.1